MQVEQAEAEWRAEAQGAWAHDATLDPTTPLLATHFPEHGPYLGVCERARIAGPTAAASPAGWPR